MRLGDIFYWNTDKVAGYDNRYKYHVYITVGDWRLDGNVFGDYPIETSPYNSEALTRAPASLKKGDSKFQITVRCGQTAGIVICSVQPWQSTTKRANIINYNYL